MFVVFDISSYFCSENFNKNANEEILTTIVYRFILCFTVSAGK